MHHHVLVTGGTGAGGRHVVSLLAAREEHPITFTYHTREAEARTLAEATGATALHLDLADAAASRDAFAALTPSPGVLIHCAATLHTEPIEDLELEAWDAQMTVNATSAFVALQALVGGMREAGGGNVVVLGALDRGQSLPIPLGFAASQGALSAFVMAAGRELGPDNIRINMISSGLLDAGLSQALDPAIFEDFTTFSAFRRLGKPEEVARAAVWLAVENTYMNGKILPVNGGI